MSPVHQCKVISAYILFLVWVLIVTSMSCKVFAVWRPCFMRVVPAVCDVKCLLSGDHASCGSFQQYVM